MVEEIIVKKFLNSINSVRENSAYWFPLAKIDSSIPVIAYYIEDIYSDNHIDLLETVMKNCDIQFITEIQLDHELVFERQDIFELLYEKDEGEYIFPWCAETYFFDDTKQWMIYVSHEGTIAFAGSKLVSCAKSIIPVKYLYR